MGIDMIVEGGVESFHVVRLNFKVTNNETEYEVVLIGLAVTEMSGGMSIVMKAYS